MMEGTAPHRVRVRRSTATVSLGLAACSAFLLVIAAVMTAYSALRSFGRLYRLDDSLIVGLVEPAGYGSTAAGIRPDDTNIEAVSALRIPRLAECGVECICSRGGVMKYGRWCGYGYAACEGRGPCDELDECCRLHDMCVSAHGYTNCSCTSALAKCARCAYLHTVRSGTGAGFCDLAAEAAVGILVELKSVLPHCLSAGTIEKRIL